MNTAADLTPRAGRIAQLCAVAVAAACALALVGRLVAAVAPASAAGAAGAAAILKPATAICIGLGAVALRLRRHEAGPRWRLVAARAVAALVAAAGVLILVEHAAGGETGAASWLSGVAASAGRVVPAGAVLFILVGAALWLLDTPRLVWLSQGLAAVGLFACLLGLVGYAYGVRGRYPMVPFDGLAVRAAAVTALLCVGLLLARPSRAITGALTMGEGAALARRILPYTVLAPVLLGALAITGFHRRAYGTELAVAFVAVSTVVTMGAVLAINARHLSRLAHTALTDALTGVGNRALFEHRLSADVSVARRWRRPLACLMVDADGFKALNDAHGHAFGDQVLRDLGRLLLDGCRREDAVCRYGGEEFVVLLPDTASGGATTLAERLRESVESHPFTHRGQPVRVTVSVGVSSIEPGPQNTPRSPGPGGGGDDDDAADRDLVERADEALYQAKQAGRNRVVVAPETASHTAQAMRRAG